MKIAVEGCAHGELDDIYDTIKTLEAEQGIKVDLLLCCGDFQSTRNEQDLRCMAVPEKYASMCSFYKYYSGEKEAPFLTIFIGGNHEASNYLQELPYGGWVAPNIYYLGYAGVVNVNGLRIGGISGIFKQMDYFKGRFEKSPYDRMTSRSVYHVRNIDIFRLKQLSGRIDVILSHDWPANITKHGNEQQLIRFKPYFTDDIQSGKLGNPFTEKVLYRLRPRYWFSGHLHCKFAALIEHDDETTTKFLALDKCLPKRRFLQIIDIDAPTDVANSNQLAFEYDLEWLTILNLTNHLVTTKKANSYMPSEHSNSERYNFTPNNAEKEHVLSNMSNSLTIPHNFTKTATVYNPTQKTNARQAKPAPILNPQTLELCKNVQIDDPIQIILTSLNISDAPYYSDGNLDISSTFTPSDVSVSTPVKRMSLPEPKNDSYDRESGAVNDEVSRNDRDVDELKEDSINTSLKRTNSDVRLEQMKDGSGDDKNDFANDEEVFCLDVTGNIPVESGKNKFKRRNIDMYRDN